MQRPAVSRIYIGWSMPIALTLVLFAITPARDRAQLTRAGQTGGNSMHENLQDAVAADIQAFATGKKISDLQKAIIDLKSASSGQNSQHEEASQDDALGMLWLQLFSALDSNMRELKSNLKYPHTHVQPMSSGPDSPYYPPGTPPSAIMDPVVRQQYEAALAENKKRIEAVKYYGQLRKLNDDATAFFWSWGASRYRDDARTGQALLNNAKSLGLSAERVERLREAVISPN